MNDDFDESEAVETNSVDAIATILNLDRTDRRAAMQARREFDEKYLVNGALLVTEEQYSTLVKVCAEQELQDLRTFNPMASTPLPTDINVVVVPRSGEPTDVGGGVFAVQKFGAIYVFKSPDPIIPKPFPADRPRLLDIPPSFTFSTGADS